MKKFGPGFLVTAAFIGPGTVATASSAGAHYGFALLWAIAFSLIATLVLQEMAARLGLVTGAGLSESLRNTFKGPVVGRLIIALVVIAIGIGNAAYEAGNIAGAVMGIQSVVAVSKPVCALAFGFLAAVLLGIGSYKTIEPILVTLVLMMSAVFLLTIMMIEIDYGALVQGLFSPSMPKGSSLTVIALIGTTVVPYNLFLHANAVREKWPAKVPVDIAIKESRRDTCLSVGIGGLVTLAVMSTAAVAFFQTGTAFTPTSLAIQLEPLLGVSAKICFALGLTAAGLTSAITAPLAAAYAVCGALGWPQSYSDWHFRAVWISVLSIGVIFASVGTQPLAAIIFAQAANGLLLPIVATVLLVLMNREEILGNYRNRLASNIVGGLVVSVAIGLGFYKLMSLVAVI
ncbi:Nramp family divalent metal transporter [Porticoccaceae bacterium]|nr:Nramp family divalent metal transporter [Porticoccaceae bacterium]